MREVANVARTSLKHSEAWSIFSPRCSECYGRAPLIAVNNLEKSSLAFA
jgi:hypothetical protein